MLRASLTGEDPAVFSSISHLWGASSSEVFKATFGSITIRHTNRGVDPGVWAWTRMNINEIWYGDAMFDSPNGVRFAPHNIAHELGHALDQRIGYRGRIDLMNASITYQSETTGLVEPLAGGTWPNGYQRSQLGFQPWPWQQNLAVSAGEEYADMFLGWSLNGFQSSSAGTARETWMNSNMQRWLALTVSNR